MLNIVVYVGSTFGFNEGTDEFDILDRVTLIRVTRGNISEKYQLLRGLRLEQSTNDFLGLFDCCLVLAAEKMRDEPCQAIVDAVVLCCRLNLVRHRVLICPRSPSGRGN